MGNPLISLTKDDGLAIIRLNRPETRNALSDMMVKEFGAALRTCESQQIRAVYITGTGSAFCSGADVKGFAEHLEQGGPEGIAAHIQSLATQLHQEVILQIRSLGKPVIAAVNGVAAGAGFSLALACDLRLASNNARFLMAYANIGATADGGSSYLLPRLIGIGKAMELYTASQPVGAQYAKELGLVEQVIPSENFERHSLEIATRIAKGPTLAYAKVKQLFNNSWNNDLESQLNEETVAMTEITASRDFQEGVKAFTQKRIPWFEGL